jgi:hypothetical protein
MKYPMNAISQCIEALIRTGSWKATKYLSDKQVVHATQKRDHRGKVPKPDSAEHIIVSLGRPNFADREFIKKCKRAGEPFPVKRVQLKAAPRRRAA